MNRFAPTIDREAKSDGGSMAFSPSRRCRDDKAG